VVGTFYYYVVITNTNTGATGPNKTATTTSTVAKLTVEPPPSTECNVEKVSAGFVLGANITGIVSNHTTLLDMNNVITVSDKATWILYSNPAMTTQVNKVINPLVAGDNIRYIRVTAEDGITTKDYTITINRKSSFIGKFTTAPQMNGTLDPAVWGDKVFTLAAGAEGSPLRPFTGRTGYPPAGFNADIYLTYDAQNLYLGLIVNDPVWTGAPAANIWRGCGIQVDIWNTRPATGANNEGNRREYGFALTPTGKAFNQFNAPSGTTNLNNSGYNNYDIVRVPGTDTFIYTIGIPLSSFRSNAAANPLLEGQELLFAISYNWPDTGSNMACAYDMGFHDKNPNDSRSLILGANVLAKNAIIKADVSGKVVTSVLTLAEKPDETTLVLASYDTAGALIDVKTFEPTLAGGQFMNIAYDFGNAANVKAFLWDKNTMAPLAESKVVFGT
jgi:hypothetical protein